MDPRIGIIDERFRDIGNIISVGSGKGGVGKSIVAANLALQLAEKGLKVGLLDLDFQGSSDHVILGLPEKMPEEKKGIIPPTHHGIKFISLVYYTQNRPVPFRGRNFTDALLELLAVTIWGKLDFLIMDMPPGIGDHTLDLIEFIKQNAFLIVTTPSKVAFETVKKLITFLKEQKIPLLGLLENMKLDDSNYVWEESKKMEVSYLGALPFDQSLENAIGKPEKLRQTELSHTLLGVTDKILENLRIPKFLKNRI
jgi:ATP-binding protein involved in chromosome partitioning